LKSLSNDRAGGRGRGLLHPCVLLIALAGILSGCTLGAAPLVDVTTNVAEFGENPGGLRMYKYVPAKLPPSPAMVVVLHHCFQHANSYIDEAGWRPLADRYGFVLLLPEQVPGNDFYRCFGWYSAENRRGKGEVESIREMVEKMAADYHVDRSRIFVTGLSSGGSMTLVMLAAHPELFAGGGEVGGVPMGCAASSLDMPVCQTVGISKSPREWGDAVRAASPGQGPWPILSIWHGPNDVVSVPENGKAILAQWTNLHGATTVRQDTVEGYPHSVYLDSSGRAVVEFYEITGMGHSVPVDFARGCGDGRDGIGNFVSDMHICSSFYMAKFWGLIGPSDELKPAATN
jgi:poly(hydroxyalkanoate) depolymerase family esterase